MDFCAVEGGALAARGGEKFIVKRVEDHCDQKLIPLGECDGNAEPGIAMGKIGGAVQRIDVPAKLRSRCALMARSLFGSDRVVGKVSGQALDDEPFRALVRLGDKIDLVAFIAKLERA